MHVFLIHGMGRTPVSMWVLRQRLRRAGHRSSLFGYTVTVSALEQITQRFVAHVRGVQKKRVAKSGGGAPPYAIVGHSLGNTIARLASPELPDGFSRFVMLAPPNHTPAIARTLRDNPIYRATTRETGQLICDEQFFEELPVPDVESLIIAGDRGPRSSWLPFEGAPNDSILKVEETHLEGISTIVVPGVHTFLMNRRDVFETVQEFLARGAGAVPHAKSRVPLASTELSS